ncbi:MAG: hypothetical protein JWM28_2353 [Chitinophagaceae bacterium]|nr:hypothetical protein [Chitinophagaceae bacterium]
MRKQKHFLIFFVFFLSFFIPSAQLKLPINSGFQSDVETIIKDYPNSFQHYIGEELVANPQSTDYLSMLQVNGSEECHITKYPAKGRSRYSFQAVMLTTDDFETAKSSFHNFYKQLNNLSVHIGSGWSFQLQGAYETPSEEKKFTSSIFSADPAGGEGIKQLRVELLMEYVLMEWKIKVLVYEKEREDDEPGEIKTN